MGNSNSNVKTNHVEEIENIDDDDLDRKQRLFKKSILEIYTEIKEVKDSKSDKIFYKLPAINLCSYSLF